MAPSKARNLLSEFTAEMKETFGSSKGDDGPSYESAQNMSRLRWCIRSFLFNLLFLVNVLGFISDWLFFIDVTILKKGLVYGPAPETAMYFFVLLAIFGTVTFIFETMNLWSDYYKAGAWADVDGVSVFVIWIKEIPQMFLTLYLASCREEPISIFQTMKAAVILIGVVVRIVLCAYNYRKALQSKHHVKYKAMIMVGVLIESFCAIAVFALNQTEHGGAVGMTFRVPKSFTKEQFNDQRYFKDVHIFVHHHDLFDAGALDPDHYDSDLNWVRLVSLNNMRVSKDAETSISLQYQLDGKILKMAFWESLSSAKKGTSKSSKSKTSSSWTMQDCYSIDQSMGNITEETNTTCLHSGFFTNPRNLFIKFVHVQPGQIFTRQVFGDIHFNMKLNSTSTNNTGQRSCVAAYDYNGNVNSRVDRNFSMKFLYFQTREGARPTDGKHLLTDASTGAVRFFRNNGKDLKDIKKVWETGWLRCACTGRTSPMLAKGLKVDCSRT